MSQGDQPQVGGVVTGRGAGRNFKLPLLIAGSVVALLALGGGAWYATKYGPFAPKPPVVKRENMTPAQQLAAAKEELSKASSPQAKATAYNHLGEAYFNSGQTKDAINAYNQALTNVNNTGGSGGDGGGSSSTSINSPEILALGDLSIAYLKAGDTANEIKVLEQLVPLLQKSTDPDAERLVFRYQQLLDGLKAEQ